GRSPDGDDGSPRRPIRAPRGDSGGSPAQREAAQVPRRYADGHGPKDEAGLGDVQRDTLDLLDDKLRSRGLGDRYGNVASSQGDPVPLHLLVDAERRRSQGAGPGPSDPDGRVTVGSARGGSLVARRGRSPMALVRFPRDSGIGRRRYGGVAPRVGSGALLRSGLS